MCCCTLKLLKHLEVLTHSHIHIRGLAANLKKYSNNTLNPATANLVHQINFGTAMKNPALYEHWPPRRRRNETAHCFTRENPPGPATSRRTVYSAGTAKKRWPSPAEVEASMYPHTPKTMSRASLIRQAQTNSSPSHPIFHHINKRSESPTCPECGRDYTSIPHTY